MKVHALAMMAIAFIITSLPAPALGEYHPTLGRFMQRDPLGYVDGGNLYEYVRSAPVRYVDPSGMVAVVDDVAMVSLGAKLLADSLAGSGMAVTSKGIIVPAAKATGAATVAKVAAGSTAATLGTVAVAIPGIALSGALVIDWVAHGDPIWNEYSRIREGRKREQIRQENLQLTRAVWAEARNLSQDIKTEVERKAKCPEGYYPMYRYLTKQQAKAVLSDETALTSGWHKGASISPDLYVFVGHVHENLAIPRRPRKDVNNTKSFGSVACLCPDEHTPIRPTDPQPDFGYPEPGGREAETTVHVQGSRIIGVFPLIDEDRVRDITRMVRNWNFNRPR